MIELTLPCSRSSIMALAILLSLAGCSRQQPPETTATAADTAAQVADARAQGHEEGMEMEREAHERGMEMAVEARTAADPATAGDNTLPPSTVPPQSMPADPGMPIGRAPMDKGMPMMPMEDDMPSVPSMPPQADPKVEPPKPMDHM